MNLRYGSTRVPVTASWTGEERFYLDRCRWFGGLAICQDEVFANGGMTIIRGGDHIPGKPQFGKPHMQRQRRAMAEGRCDICGRSLRTATKVSLSHAWPQPHGAEGWAILQVEPMMHRACALEAVDQCPSLKRDVVGGTLRIRQVLRWRAQCAVMSAEYVETITGQRVKALGHGKIELLEWQDRDADWLSRGTTPASHVPADMIPEAAKPVHPIVAPGLIRGIASTFATAGAA